MDNVKFSVLEIPTCIVTIHGKKFVAKQVLSSMRDFISGDDIDTPKGLKTKLKRLNLISPKNEIESGWWEFMALLRDKIAAIAAVKGD